MGTARNGRPQPAPQGHGRADSDDGKGFPVAEKLTDLTPCCAGCHKRVYKGAAYCTRCTQELADKGSPTDPLWSALESRIKHYWAKTRRDPEAMERHRQQSRDGMKRLRERRKKEH